MGKIKAPFNFVPMWQKVYNPEWENLISQDIPFEDGLSGSIYIEFKSETPVFIRNASDSKDSNDCHSCRTPDGRFMIPGTTIKGEVRNILSILSCGKMRVGKDVRFAQREWDNDEELYTLKREAKNLKCGWLIFEKNNYVIKNCGEPYRIGMDEIDSYIGRDIMFNNFSVQSGRNLNNKVRIDNIDYDPKTAVYKYKLLENINLHGLKFSEIGKRRKVKVDEENGNIVGSIIMTGQPGLYKYPRPEKNVGGDKFYEFVFPEKIIKSIPIDEEIYRQYSLMYSDSNDWKYWKKKGKGIPVFFRLNSNGTVKDFGLAFLYKLPYEKTVAECAVQISKQPCHDMSDCIFGYTSDKDSLKGRVQFSSAFSDNAEESDKVKLVLNNPKASYYPIYIKQDVSTDGKVSTYKTYNNGEIAGYKRYIQRDVTWNKSVDGVSDKLLSTLIPLKPGALFKGIIRFHNLKEVELGALLSALTFHNNLKCCHQFGQAKPYGFGRTSVQNIKLNIIRGTQFDLEYYMAIFEKQMNNVLYNTWLLSEQLRELFALVSNVIPENKSSDFEYMFHDNKNSDFIDVKKDKEALKKFSRITKPVIINSLYDKYKSLIEENIRLKKEEKRIAEERAKTLKEEIEKKIAEENAAKEAMERELKKNEKISEGLSSLNEKKNSSDSYKVNDFAGGYKRIIQWQKKTSINIIGEEYESDLIQWLSRSYSMEKKAKDKDVWKDRMNKNVWGKLEQIMEKSFVDKLFSAVIS